MIWPLEEHRSAAIRRRPLSKKPQEKKRWLVTRAAQHMLRGKGILVYDEFPADVFLFSGLAKTIRGERLHRYSQVTNRFDTYDR